MKLYFWSSFIALLIHSSCSVEIDSNYVSSDRQPRHNAFRGNSKFELPTYLNQNAYAQPVYSSDRRGPDGSFSYEYGTSNGIHVKQDSNGYGPNKVVRGYYSYVGSDGITYTVNYIADRYGYRAYGTHLPKQPHEVVETPKIPVYTRPVSNQAFVTSQPPPAVYPLRPHNHQHQTQSAYYSTPLPSQNIYVTESAPPNYINITPKPFYVTPTKQPTFNLQPPNAYSLISQQYPNQPIVWTTAKPSAVYNSGFSSSTPSPYSPY
ncbi:CLUMA_CG010012, isoform A [Clunio marinus]|uniref:CLUMA_CG010012, isoform A n=1 Tax=Clunio marinus TaxID=568069 RepID=A0A1J1IC34_9DIPT|nr:CLUMA_CG010012, isoform A [Clunio marinus]